VSRVNQKTGLARRIHVSAPVSEKTRVDLEGFVASEYPKVVAAVGLITGNRQDAADAVQDALVGYLSTPPARGVDNLAAWITVVASNRLRDRSRRGAAEARALAKLGQADDAVTDELTLLDIDVRTALLELPIQQRQVCILHYLMDQSVETIAEGLGVSTGTIKTQLHRARTRLSTRLERGTSDEESR
jgi:RNA polymerase sigma-70 factor (ECF subfamily)